MVAGWEVEKTYSNTYDVDPVGGTCGGSKLSGVGRESAEAAIDHYSQLKSVYVGMAPVEAPF